MPLALTLFCTTFLILIPLAVGSAIGTNKIIQNTELCIATSLLSILSLMVLIVYAYEVMKGEAIE